MLPCRFPRLWTVALVVAVTAISIGITVTAVSTIRVTNVDVQYCELFMNRTCQYNETLFLVANRYRKLPCSRFFCAVA